MTADPFLELDGLCRVFPAFELGPLSMSFQAGHVYGVLGPNGAGKTTLLNLITLQLKPTSGAVRNRGSVIRWGDPEWKRRFSYIRERPSFYDELTVRETLELASRLYGRWDATLAHTLVGRFKLPPSQRVGRLSKGTKVKLGLVAALAHRADLLILDEPTAGLDPTARADLQDTVNELVKEHPALCVVLSSHIFEDIEQTATDVCILRQGRLALEKTSDDLKRTVVYCSIAAGAVAPSSDLVLQWTRRNTHWLAVRGDSRLDRDLTLRSDHVKAQPDSLLGAIYHGTEHSHVD
ncbi:MAG TPA: ABC transporter ATP-binding protein [Acidobacteria bacterium]|nr:ABC transporter ATP-binding protein [Acidobacteriota bacterium]